jgi:hypothetical protein
MEFEHWSNAEAIAEMKECGYSNLDKELDILEFLEQYRPSWMPKAETPAPAEAKEATKAKKGQGPKPAAHGRPRRRRNLVVNHPPV